MLKLHNNKQTGDIVMGEVETSPLSITQSPSLVPPLAQDCISHDSEAYQSPIAFAQ